MLSELSLPHFNCLCTTTTRSSIIVSYVILDSLLSYIYTYIVPKLCFDAASFLWGFPTQLLWWEYIVNFSPLMPGWMGMIYVESCSLLSLLPTLSYGPVPRFLVCFSSLEWMDGPCVVKLLQLEPVDLGHPLLPLLVTFFFSFLLLLLRRGA